MGEFLRAFLDWWIAGPHRDVEARRRLFWVFGLILVVLIMAQFPLLELGFLYSLDLGLLFETSALLYVLAVRDNGRGLLHAVRQIPGTARMIFSTARRGFARARRHVGEKLKLPQASDEDGAAWAIV